MSVDIIIDETVSFLKKVPPFQFLDEDILKRVAMNISMEFYPKDTIILRENGLPSEYLRIIKKGAVKVFMNSSDGEEIVIDYRGEGDSFGFLSLISGDKSRANVVAVDDTICYLINRETVLNLLDLNPSLTEFFLKSFLNKYMDRTYREIKNRSILYGGGEKLLFTTPVGEIIAREVVTGSEKLSIKEAAEIMSRNRISSLIIVDDDGVPQGIITDRDLRDKVVARGRDGGDSVREIMSVGLIKVDSKEYCFEALLKMIKYNIHHLLIIEEGKLKGVVTNHDLMLLQGTSPLSIAREIESQYSIDGLIPVARKITHITGMLLKEGARASNIIKIITVLNDRLIRKVIEIAEKRFGTPPLPYCFIVFGSEGRMEQTFRTDQDNAVIYADPSTEEENKKAVEYFSVITRFIRDGLLKCGFPICPRDYMASNPQWCQPLKVWKRYFSRWITEPTGDSIQKSMIFFDFRPIYGDPGLADQLKEYLKNHLREQKVFLGHMANIIIKNKPPLGFLKSFVVEKSGEHKNELNLKIKAITPFVDIIRLFSLEKGIDETSTFDRIEILKDKHTIVKEYADEIKYAFEFIMLLRIHHQYEQIQSGVSPDNFINPDKLSNLERKTLKDSFHLISKLQDILIERYKPLIW